jgi:hypothetical protein
MKVDRENLAWLRPLVDRDGFPTVAEVGAGGVDDAWILVQHADTDHPFQSRVLEQIRPRMATGEITGQEFALLTDRVLLAEGKKQRIWTSAAPPWDCHPWPTIAALWAPCTARGLNHLRPRFSPSPILDRRSGCHAATASGGSCLKSAPIIMR